MRDKSRDPRSQQRNSSASKKKTFGNSSNKKNLANAITSVLLAGTTNDFQRMDVLDCLNKSAYSNFIILFKNTGRQNFQGLYAFDSEGEVIKVYGGDKLPTVLNEAMISTYYKYSSAGKAFSVITGNKAMSIAVDAVELKQLANYKR